MCYENGDLFVCKVVITNCTFYYLGRKLLFYFILDNHMRTAHGPTSSGPPSPSSINTATRWVYRLQLNLFAIVLIAVKRVPKYRHPRSSLWMFE